MDTAMFRPDQARRFSEVASTLRGLDDETLGVVHLELMTLAYQAVEAGHKVTDPLPWAYGMLGDLAGGELDHRQMVLWNVEADLRGGHKVYVTNDWTDVGIFEAFCAPVWDDSGETPECWAGPPRATFEAAVEDGRRHNPGHEPDDLRA